MGWGARQPGRLAPPCSPKLAWLAPHPSVRLRPPQALPQCVAQLPGLTHLDLGINRLADLPGAGPGGSSLLGALPTLCVCASFVQPPSATSRALPLPCPLQAAPTSPTCSSWCCAATRCGRCRGRWRARPACSCWMWGRTRSEPPLCCACAPTSWPLMMAAAQPHASRCFARPARQALADAARTHPCPLRPPLCACSLVLQGSDVEGVLGRMPDLRHLVLSRQPSGFGFGPYIRCAHTAPPGLAWPGTPLRPRRPPHRRRLSRRAPLPSPPLPQPAASPPPAPPCPPARSALQRGQRRGLGCAVGGRADAAGALAAHPLRPPGARRAAGRGGAAAAAAAAAALPCRRQRRLPVSLDAQRGARAARPPLTPRLLRA